MRKYLFLSVALSFLTPGLVTESVARQAGPAQTANLVAGIPNSVVLNSIRIRSLGPASYSGRVSDIAVAVDPAAPPGTRLGRVVYISAAAGGIFKTENGGKTWTPIFDDQDVLSVGAVAVAPSNPNIVWAGTGESNNLRSSSWGKGVFKSTDAGRTWRHMGLTTSQHVGRIVIHPTNPDIAFIAAGGPLWAPGGERGFYKTTDGGQTWRNTLRPNENTGVTDIVLDPTNPNTIYAATYQRERRSYSFVAGGPESGIYKSLDGGETWTRLTRGLPSGDVGRIGIDVSRSQPRTVWAHVDASDGGTFRSDDGGETWTRTSNRMSAFPWFFGQIRVDPKDPDKIYHLGVSMDMSPDGGQTWTTVARSTHADHHAMWIDPNDPDFIIIGNDGGLYFSYDGLQTADFAVNIPISQFYTVNADLTEPHYRVFGGTQDNGTWMGPVSVPNRGGINNSDWVRILGGDGFHVAIDPVEPHIVYAESQNGAISRVDLASGQTKGIRPPAPPGMRLRYNWSAPIIISPHDHKTVYFAAQVLFRSRDRGDSWDALGGDLTRNLDRDTLPIMGIVGPEGYRRHAGTAVPSNITTIAESVLREGLLYVGTDDGLVQVSRDGGRNWRRIDSFPGVPELAYVSRVTPSSHHEGTVYVTFDNHRDNDFRPYVLKSTDFGETFTSIASNLPGDGSVHVIREHHRNPNLLFVGTEFGLFFSTDGGTSWNRLSNGLPAAPVHDVVIQPRANDLVIGTHGRGIFVLHDLAPLERLAEANQARSGFVFPPADAMIQSLRFGPTFPGHRSFAVPNAPAGAQVFYLIKDGIPQNAELELAVLDRDGKLVRRLAVNRRPGLHRVAWDLRHESPITLADVALGEKLQPAPGFVEETEATSPAPPEQGQQAAAGHTVFPGDYRIQLRLTPAGGRTEVISEASVRVLRDPEMMLSDVEYLELHRWRTLAADVLFQARRTVKQAEAARAQLAARYPRGLTGDAQAVDGELAQLIGRVSGAAIMQRAGTAANAIATQYFMPTPAHRTAITDAQTALAAEIQRLQQLLPRAGTGTPLP